MNHMRVLEVIEPRTSKHHTVELEIGDRLWLKDSNSEITTVSRTDLVRTGWDLVLAQGAAW
ncbi:hypothetical protein [Pseudomonas sp. PNPG3]|uniref:hypothetical protein n=1 Tax=Pseudomonas sp. PNPG3 TaxID=2919497 RepID=UPI001FFDD46C|nr:hypothetical protein [Pseudomonas sp. PNPG3]MCK2122082.1 hypothetical protein [Pseudomonas sp. PNPG3]